MSRRPVRAASLALAAGLSLVAGSWVADRAARAQDAPREGPLACPKCRRVAAGKECADCGATLLPRDLVGLPAALARASSDEELGPGLANPLHGVVGADGSLDVAKLRRAIEDYEAAKARRGGVIGEPPGPDAIPPRPARPPVVARPGERMFATRLNRRELVAKGGGSIATESAVEAGLRWLARHQAANGHWSAAAFGAVCGGACNGQGIGDFDVGLTGLATLAFLGAGYGPPSTRSPGSRSRSGTS